MKEDAPDTISTDTLDICLDISAIKTSGLMSGDIGEKLNQLRQLYGLVDHSVADMLDGVLKHIAETRDVYGTK